MSEHSEMKHNLIDQTCELLKWFWNYRKLHNTTTREQFRQYGNIPFCFSS